MKTAVPALFALLGNPVHHSLSPALYNAAFSRLELECTYVALRTYGELVPSLMRALAVDGGGGNITVPFKRIAAESLDSPSEAVRATGACNVFWWERGQGLRGDNTDVEGFLLAAEGLLGVRLEGCRVLLLGAGGAARAVAYACLGAGVANLDVLNRTSDRAKALWFELGEPASVRPLAEGAPAGLARYDLIVNATTLGLGPSDPLPLNVSNVGRAAVLDLVYGERDTPLVRAARAAGLRSEDGRRMLVEQAASSFRRWFDRDPPTGAMYEAVGLLDRSRDRSSVGERSKEDRGTT